MTFLFTKPLSLLVFVAVVSATPLSTSSSYNAQRQRLTPSLAPILDHVHPHGTVNNSYLVMFKPGVSSALIQNHLAFLESAHSLVSDDGLLSGIRHVYSEFGGYAGSFSQGVLDQIRGMPEVDYIERDQIVRIMDTQSQAPWGLARISHREKLTFSTFSKYVYDPTGGKGVDVYVIDTGININHVEFGGRAVWGATIPINNPDTDDNGHGTHCAGTIASQKYGVAKAARVIAVKVLGSNGSGTMSDVIKGVEFAVNAATQSAQEAAAEYRATGKTALKGSVANMSLGGGKSPALEAAVNAAVDRGLHFAVAAGNDGQDACNYSPAGAGKAITVGASTLGDERAYFSNHGKCVHVFAPGHNIISTYIGSDTATATLSGTSMASPHTAGLMAYLLSLYPSVFHPKFSVQMVDTLPPMASFNAQHTFDDVSSVYAFVHAVLPRWLSDLVLPFAATEEEGFATAPVPPTLTPQQLKQAVLSLATKDILTQLPPNTVNLLIHNNATK